MSSTVAAQASRIHRVEAALLALCPLVVVLYTVLHEWVHVGAVTALFMVSAAKVRTPEAAWLNWKPQIPARG